MAQPYIGEIRMFGGNFAPVGWELCDGRLMSISENEPLFQLIGTTYGGDGQETFRLPDLRGRVPIGQSSNYSIGQMAGTESVTLTTQQIPDHIHFPFASSMPATTSDPAGNLLANSTADLYTSPNSLVALAPNSITSVGGNQPHENRQPFLCVNFIISLYGIYPTSS